MKDYIILISMHADPAMAPGYDEWGGTHTYMRELLDEFGKRKINCILITRRGMRHLPCQEKYNDYCTIYRLTNGENEPMNKIHLMNYHSYNVEQIMQIILEQPMLPTVIHSVYWNSGRIAAEISDRLGIPFVHSIISNSKGRVKRGAYEPILERSKYEQEIYNKAKWLICVSNDEANDLINLYNIEKNKIVVAGQYIHDSFIMPSHDENGFPRLNANLTVETQKLIAASYNKALTTVSSNDSFWSKKMFTYMGRIDKNKGLLHICSAWYWLNQKYNSLCPSLWIIGGSLLEIEELRSALKDIIPNLNSLEHYGRIVWWGCLDPSGLSTILLKTSVLLTHSLYEPGGRVIIEAMSEGVPVISTPNGFGRDSVQNWKNGFLVDFGDERTLAARMEHFIRQPFLSNSLGHCAAETALNVIKSWRFIEKHLECYFNSPIPSTDKQIAIHDTFRKREITLYPYCNQKYSEVMIGSFFTEQTGKKADTIERLEMKTQTSEIYRVLSEKEEYIVKRIFTRLALSPLYNPICKEEYVRTSHKLFNTELAAYLKNKSSLLVGYDRFHSLLLLKKAEKYAVSDIESIKKCVFAILRNNHISEEYRSKYIEIIRDIETLGVEKTLIRLNSEFNEFFFDPSCIFDNSVCSKAIHNILKYNEEHISPESYSQLLSFANFFASKSYNYSSNQICTVNIEVESNHIFSFNNDIYIIDLEKNSIGFAESEISGLVYDCISNKKEKIAEIFSALSTVEQISIKALIANTAFRFIYDFIINCVIDRYENNDNLDILLHLKERYEYYESLSDSPTSR